MNAENTNTNAPASSLPPSPANSSPPLLPAQLSGESARAFEALLAYFELGPTRRYAAVANRVGSSVRTIRRWAADHNWRARINACAAHSAEDYAQTQAAIRTDEMLDRVARNKSLRERQYAVAESLLDVAELYLARIESLDLDQMSFSDACKALQVAVHLGKQAGSQPAKPSAADPDPGLHEQLSTFLD